MADLTAGAIPKRANVPNSGVGSITASSNTVTVGADANGATIYTAGTSGGRVYVLLASLNDTVAVNLILYILDGATVLPLGMVLVPASSGNIAATPNVNLLDPSNATQKLLGLPVDENGNRYIPLKASQILKGGALANLTALKILYVTAIGSDYQA